MEQFGDPSLGAAGQREHGHRAMPRVLDDAWLERLASLIATSPVNLVSRADRDNVLGVHLDECVRIAAGLSVRPGDRWLDLGTGGGLPGLILAACYPESAWCLLDARAKKIRQVAAFARELGLTNVDAVHDRAEDRAETGTQVDGVISRAVGSLPETVVLSRPLVAEGQIVAVRGPRARSEVEELRPWCDDLGLSVSAVTEVDGTMRPTWLVHLRTQGSPPPRFPTARRALLRSSTGGSS